MLRMSKWAMALAGGVSLFAVSVDAQAQTLSETLAQAYNSNPTLQAERARLRVTDEGRVQARSARLPSAAYFAD